MVYVIQVCWQLASTIRTDLHLDPACKLSAKSVWHIPLLCVQWKTPDDGQRNCPKHEEFYSKNKFEKLVHLVGFIIRIYHDAQPPERQIRVILTTFKENARKMGSFRSHTHITLNKHTAHWNSAHGTKGITSLMIFHPFFPPQMSLV